MIASWAALVWLCALLSPRALRWHPAAGAWTAWALWSGVCALRAGRPVERAELWIAEASGVLLLVLAHAWWGGAHRRIWALGFWLAGILALIAWPWPIAVALAAAGSASALAVAMSAAPTAPKWRAELALAGAAGLVFVFVLGTWASRFAALISLACCYALERRRLDLWFGVAALAACGWGLVRHLQPGPPYIYELLAQSGWIGLALYLVAVFRSLPGRIDRQGWEARAATAALLALFAQGFADAASAAVPLQAVFFSAIACASPWGRVREEASGGTEETQEWVKPKWAAAIGLLFCAAVIGAHRAEQSARMAASASAFEVRTDALRRLAALEPGESAPRIDLAREWIAAGGERIGAALAWLDDAIRLTPDDALLYGMKAQLFFAVGDWRRGGEWAAKALSLAPNFAVARLLLAEARARGGDRESAREELAKALKSRGSDVSGAGWDEARYRKVLQMIEHAR